MNAMNLTRVCNFLRLALKSSARGLAAGAWLAAGTALAAPPNDDFANAIDLTGSGTGQTGDAISGDQTGTNTSAATLQAGEPNPGAGNTVWFKWTCPADGKLKVSTTGSTDTTLPTPGQWDAILGIYTGAALNALTPLGTTPQDTNLDETMTVPVTAGTTYSIQLAGFGNQEAANILLGWNFVETIYEAGFLTFGPGATVGDVVDNKAAIAWNVPHGTNVATLAPTFTLTAGATATVGGLPAHSGDPVDLTNPVDFKVTSAGPSPVVNVYTVTVNVVPTLIWNAPGGSDDWDFTSENWINQQTATGAVFADGRVVIFNKPVGGTINITSAVSPLSTTVSNGEYSFIGEPIAGAGPVIMDGPGTLTLGNANTYTGKTVVNGGTLDAVGNGSIAGSTSFSVAGDGALVLLNTSGNAYKWPAAAAPLTGTGTVSIPLGGGFNTGLNFDMTGFTGILDISNGMVALNPYYSPSFASPVGGTIVVENNTTLYLGWTGLILNTTVKLKGGNDNGEGYGVLRGDTATINGAVILDADSTIGCSGPGGKFTINAVISDGGHGFGFTQVKDGTVILAAANTYSGATVVSGGATLQCNTPNALGSGGPLSIISGGKAILNYSGSKVIASLTLGGVMKTAPGTYGSGDSGAQFSNDSYFSGTGTVTITAGSEYDGWLSGFTFAAGADKTPTGDPDGDGLSNQQEYAFGLDPTLGASVNPITQPLNATTGNFQYTRRATPAATGLTYTVLTSVNLVDWVPGGATETGFTTSGGIETVSVHVTATPVGGKLFVRVKAAQAQ